MYKDTTSSPILYPLANHIGEQAVMILPSTHPKAAARFLNSKTGKLSKRVLAEAPAAYELAQPSSSRAGLDASEPRPSMTLYWRPTLMPAPTKPDGVLAHTQHIPQKVFIPVPMRDAIEMEPKDVEIADATNVFEDEGSDGAKSEDEVEMLLR